ncbi:MAG: type 4a pilus biogenesis protein PilO [Terriglobia bacterium]
MNRWYARRRWVYWSLVILLALDAMVYFGWLRRPLALPGSNPAAVARLEREVTEQAREVARLRRVRNRAPQLRPQLERFTRERFLAAQRGFSRVAAELEEAANEAGVNLDRVSYKIAVARDESELVRIEIGTSVKGGYRNLLRYLEELERSPHFYLINELKVEGAERGQVQLEMRLATYFRRSRA